MSDSHKDQQARIRAIVRPGDIANFKKSAKAVRSLRGKTGTLSPKEKRAADDYNKRRLRG